MGLFRKNGGVTSGSRIFFATDLHGSEVCFRKLLGAPEAYGATTVIMGGDCTGKSLVPFIENGSVSWSWSGERFDTTDADQVSEAEQRIRNSGAYPIRLDPDQAARFNEEPAYADSLFTQVMLDTVAGWAALARERLESKGIQMIFTPGNDDEFAIDDVLSGASYIDFAEGRITRIGEHEMLSLGWSNPTPWDTPRECSEEELRSKIDALAVQLQDPENAIFNIHVPPRGTGLDEAPELDSEMRPVRGGAVTTGVGSSAVREAILEYQPLLGLHGHIHESRGIQKLGRTTCINPGSAYGDWVLQGVFVQVAPGKVKNPVLVTG